MLPAGWGWGVVDFEQVMEAAAARAGESAMIVGSRNGGGAGVEAARVWVDGVSAMSGLEMRMLAALGEHAREVTITLLADPDAAEMIEMRGTGQIGAAQNEEGHGLFARTERLHRRLTDLFRQRRVRVIETLALRERFRFAAPALRQLAAELWRGGEETRNAKRETRNHKSETRNPKPEIENPRIEAQITNHESRITAHDAQGGVELWECSDPETEVRVVAQAIRNLVIGSGAENADGKNHGLRYRQIGIIVPDMEGYGDALRRVLGEHGIPHFIDERRGLGHHPLVELLRSAVAIAESGWDREDLLLYMKTRLAGVSEEQAAWVENYIIEHGITHVSWSEPWTWMRPMSWKKMRRDMCRPAARERLQQVNAVRQKVWGDLRLWWELAGGLGGAGGKRETRNAKRETAGSGTTAQETNNGAAWATGLRRLLERLAVPAQMEKWAARARRHPARSSWH